MDEIDEEGCLDKNDSSGIILGAGANC